MGRIVRSVFGWTGNAALVACSSIFLILSLVLAIFVYQSRVLQSADPVFFSEPDQAPLSFRMVRYLEQASRPIYDHWLNWAGELTQYRERDQELSRRAEAELLADGWDISKYSEFSRDEKKAVLRILGKYFPDATSESEIQQFISYLLPRLALVLLLLGAIDWWLGSKRRRNHLRVLARQWFRASRKDALWEINNRDVQRFALALEAMLGGRAFGIKAFLRSARLSCVLVLLFLAFYFWFRFERPPHLRLLSFDWSLSSDPVLLNYAKYFAAIGTSSVVLDYLAIVIIVVLTYRYPLRSRRRLIVHLATAAAAVLSLIALKILITVDIAVLFKIFLFTPHKEILAGSVDPYATQRSMSTQQFDYWLYTWPWPLPAQFGADYSSGLVEWRKNAEILVIGCLLGLWSMLAYVIVLIASYLGKYVQRIAQPIVSWTLYRIYQTSPGYIALAAVPISLIVSLLQSVKEF